MSTTNLDLSHGISTAVVTVALAKGYTMAMGNDTVPMMTQVEAGAINGVGAVLADNILPKQSTAVRAGVTGVLTAGAMYAYHGDQLWWFWIPLGAGSYLVGDFVMKQYSKASDKNSASNGTPPPSTAGEQMPVIPGY